MKQEYGHASTGRLSNLRTLTLPNVGLAVLEHPRLQNAPRALSEIPRMQVETAESLLPDLEEWQAASCSMSNIGA